MINCNAGKVDGKWGSWESWGECNPATGTKSRSRDCDNPAPQNGGSSCPGDSEQTKDCKIVPTILNRICFITC